MTVPQPVKAPACPTLSLNQQFLLLETVPQPVKAVKLMCPEGSSSRMTYVKRLCNIGNFNINNDISKVVVDG
jgi:hypothetical protein